MDLIKNCFDALKPWLDKDMYFSMKEKEDSTRINANYGKSTKYKDTKINDYAKLEDNDGDGILID